VVLALRRAVPRWVPLAAVVLAAALGLPSVVGSVAGARTGPTPSGVVVATSRAPNPYSTGMAASLVIGEQDFTQGALGGTGAVNESEPQAAAFAPDGWLWVVDSANNRVLGYPPPFTTGMAATVALGQTSLTTHVAGTAPTASDLWEPASIAVNASGDVFVADTTNNRVLGFDCPCTTGMSASVVLGQTLFTTNTAGTPAASANLYRPDGLAFNGAGDLFVSDRANNRVLEYAPPFANGEPATVVLGQSGFTGSVAGLTAKNLSFPQGLAVASDGSLWVADARNERVLEFPVPLSTGEASTLVLGQTNFTTTGEGLPNGMVAPTGLAFDGHGDLWVADGQVPNRVSEFLPPFVSNQTASVVLGQTSLTGTAYGTTASELDSPFAVAIDSAGHVWVVDTGNSRVVEFVPTVFHVTFTETGLASGTTWSVTFDGMTTLASTTSIAFGIDNGSYGFAAGSVGGYSASPGSGTVVVNGTNPGVTIDYSHTTVFGLPPVEFWGLIAAVVVLVALALAAGLLWRQRKRRRASPPSSPPQAPPASPPTSGPPNPPG
jgi:sugar lactone lactonase YvrE